MAKSSKRKLMFIALLLMLLLISSTQAILVSSVHAAEPNPQEKTLSVLSDVVGLKTEMYTTSQTEQRDSQFLNHPQTETSTYLTSAEGSVRVTCSYVKDTLQLVYLSDLEGEHPLKQPAANTVEMAKGLLRRYQNYTSNAFYGELASMLDDVDADTDLTKYAGDAKLEVSGSDQNSVSYMWTYVDENGVLAERKTVSLLYEQGQFKGFFDSWPLYTIVRTPNISSEEATAIAIEASKNYTYPVTAENGTEIMVSGFTIAPESLGHATLVYLNSKEQDYARGGDPFKLYPAWHVPLGFDKFYPGDVSGMTVILWADTGEVCGMNRAITNIGFAPPEGAEAGAGSEDAEADAGKEVALQPVNQEQTVLLNTVVVAVVICVVLLVFRKRAKFAGKKLSLKFWAMLLCAIVMLSLMLSTPVVNAVYVRGTSRVYACVDVPGYKNWGADYYEKVAMAEVCNYIGNASLDEDYYTFNMYGSLGTTVTNVVNNAGSDEQVCLSTMVFHAGHLSKPFNKAYLDNYNNSINATAIHPQTGFRRHFFIFLWVCVCAENADNESLAWAWTHRTDLSLYGYNDSDEQRQCYISFSGFSPMLSNYYKVAGNKNSTFYEYSQYSTDHGPCKDFIKDFYEYALYYDYSVHDALNVASWHYFNRAYYPNSPLCKGYDAWWPGGEEWEDDPYTPYLNDSGYYPRDFQEDIPGPDVPPNMMRVFGDSNIKLCQQTLTLSACDNNNNPLYPSFNISGATEYSGNHPIVSKSYSFYANNIPNYAFSHFSYKGNNYYRPVTLNIDSDSELKAHYNWAPIYYNLTLSVNCPGLGYTTPSGIQQCLSYSSIPVEATPYSGYALNYWKLDGNNVGNTPKINVYMSGPHTLQALFTTAPAYKYASSIYGYGGTVSAPEYLTGWQPDGQFAGLLSTDGNYGWIIGAMNAQATGHIYLYGCCSAGGAGLLYVYVSSDGSNWNPVNAIYVSETSPYWIDCGTYAATFNYIGVGVQSPGAAIEIDSVKVTT